MPSFLIRLTKTWKRFWPELIFIGLCLALMPSRLLGVHGVENALVLSLVFGPFALLRSAIAKRDKALGAAAESFAIEISRLLFLSIVLIGVNQLRIKQCTPGEGLVFELLGPVMSAAFGVSLGLLVRALFQKLRLRIFISILIVLAFAFVAAFEYYATPAVFAYSHLFGFHPGPLYDVGRELGFGLISFRAITLAWCASLLTVAFGVDHFRRTKKLSWHWASVLIPLSLAIAGSMHASRLGHRSTRMSIEKTLGHRQDGEFCRAFMPRETPLARRNRLVQDCDFRVWQMRKRLGIEGGNKVNAYFYRDELEKARLMGAGRTFIAKPWRREIHLQMRAWPHRVLAHEVVHAVAADIGSGPFKIAGTFGGLLPNPGLIEGLAVAVAWDERKEATPHQAAKAMLKLERLPKVDDLMSLGFLKISSSRAYGAAGSFLRFVIEEEGIESVRESYRRGEFVGDRNELEKRWRGFLESDVELETSVFEKAKLRLSRPGIFSQVCPHHSALLQEDISASLAAKDNPKALRLANELLDIDPKNLEAAYTKLIALAANAKWDEVERTQMSLESDQALWHRANVRRGNYRWRQHAENEARSAYQTVDIMLMPRALQRELIIKRHAFSSKAKEAIRDYFFGEPDNQLSNVLRMDALRRMSDEPQLAAYLLGRALFHREHFRAAFDVLSQVDALPGEVLQTELYRMKALVSLALGKWIQAEANAEKMKAVGNTIDRAVAEDLLERIAFLKSR